LQQQGKFHKGYLLTDIAQAMRQTVKLTPYRYKFRLYKTAFVATDAIDYLIAAGYAYSRPEAVHLGRKLAKEYQLMEHMEGKYLFEDEPYRVTRSLPRPLKKPSQSPCHVILHVQ
jgi:hypothetical protein